MSFFPTQIECGCTSRSECNLHSLDYSITPMYEYDLTSYDRRHYNSRGGIVTTQPKKKEKKRKEEYMLGYFKTILTDWNAGKYKPDGCEIKFDISKWYQLNSISIRSSNGVIKDKLSDMRITVIDGKLFLAFGIIRKGCLAFSIETDEITDFFRNVRSKTRQNMSIDKIDLNHAFLILPLISDYIPDSLKKHLLEHIRSTPEYDGILYEKMTGKTFDFKKTYNKLFGIEEPPAIPIISPTSSIPSTEYVSEEIQDNEIVEEILIFSSEEECDVCMETYDNENRIPRVFSECRHSLCDICIHNMVEHAEDKKIKCHACRKEYPDYQEALYSLQTKVSSSFD